MVEVRALTVCEIEAHLDDVARLRIAVFRDWPYLYDGRLEYERDYVRSYCDAEDALLVAAFDAGVLVGASTSTRMEAHAEAFAEPLKRIGVPVDRILYGPESALLPAYRGRGIGHQFFDLREAHARRLGRSHVAFCSIVRAADDPKRPPDARTNDAFWAGCGYAPLPGVTAQFSWTDAGDTAETEKSLQFWMRKL